MCYFIYRIFKNKIININIKDYKVFFNICLNTLTYPYIVKY